MATGTKSRGAPRKVSSTNPKDWSHRDGVAAWNALITANQIAEILGITPQATNHWLNQDDFPDPVGKLGKRGRVWLRAEVLAWLEREGILG